MNQHSIYFGPTNATLPWKGICTFMTDGRLEVDNNLTEQEMKAFAVLRKNILFSQSVEGAKALCLHLTLIRTAVHHQLDPFAYYHWRQWYWTYFHLTRTSC